MLEVSSFAAPVHQQSVALLNKMNDAFAKQSLFFVSCLDLLARLLFVNFRCTK